MKLTLWLLPLVPFVLGLLTYIGLKRQWHFGWLVALGWAGSTPVWLAVFVLAYLLGFKGPSALAPFIVALFVAIFTHLGIRLKLELSPPRFKYRLRILPGSGFRYFGTVVMAFSFLLALLFIWLLERPEPRFIAAVSVPFLLIVFVYFLFERSQQRDNPEQQP